MCGRYSLSTDTSKLAAHFRLDELPVLFDKPHYNIAPTTTAPVVRLSDDGKRRGGMLRWGLIPSWAKDIAIGNRMINARAETLTEKPAFRAAWRQRRCLVPADGFYEWQKLPDRKQPMFLRARSGELLGLAGLWERWEDIESFTIITTTPNELVRPIHDRMPAIIEPADYDRWLDPRTPLDDVAALLCPYPEEALMAYPVSARVNSPRVDDASLCEAAEKGGQ